MNANTNINVLGGILDAMLANLVEMIDKRVEAKVEELTQRIVALETNQFREAAISVIKPTDDVILRLDKMEQSLSARAVQIESLGIDQRDDAKRIDALEQSLSDLNDNTPTALREDVNSLMNCQDHDQMENSRRLSVLEARLAGEQPNTTKFDLCILDSEEFRLAVIKIIDQQVMEDTFLNPLVDALVDSDKFNDAVNTAAVDAASSEVEEALDNHTSDYDHDDIHEMSDHEMDSDAIREVVEEILNNSTVTFKI
jgi:hypothetical protein